MGNDLQEALRQFDPSRGNPEDLKKIVVMIQRLVLVRHDYNLQYILGVCTLIIEQLLNVDLNILQSALYFCIS